MPAMICAARLTPLPTGAPPPTPSSSIHATPDPTSTRKSRYHKALLLKGRQAQQEPQPHPTKQVVARWIQQSTPIFATLDITELDTTSTAWLGLRIPKPDTTRAYTLPELHQAGMTSLQGLNNFQSSKYAPRHEWKDKFWFCALRADIYMTLIGVDLSWEMTTPKGSDLWGGSRPSGCSRQLYGGSIQPPIPWVLPPVFWGWEPPYGRGKFCFFGPRWAPFGALFGVWAAEHSRVSCLCSPEKITGSSGKFDFLGPAGPRLVHCLRHKQPSILGPAALYVVDPRAQFATLHVAQKKLLVPAGNFGFWGPSGPFGVLILWVP
ncbi:hypothetical protein C8R44DRAFT_748896 [Mycena epipterygia]|nr:hypothetical protein C8R44DRAFT_748896 [Mycena epipterygia]